MNRLIIAISIVTVLTSCNSTNKKVKMDEQKNETISKVSTNDTIPKVTGIGGIFFFPTILMK